MKKAIYLFTFLAFVGMSFLTSCGDDDENLDATPSIDFIGGTYTDGDATFTVGADFAVKITASQNANSGKKLTNLKVVRTFDNTPTTVVDSTISVDTYTWEDSLVANAVAGVEKWTFTITDKDGETKEISFNITTELDVTPLGSYIEFTLGYPASNPSSNSTSNSVIAIEYKGNPTSNTAKFIATGSNKFLSITDVSNILTQEDLKDEYDTNESNATIEFTQQSDANFTENWFATKVNNVYYLVHFKSAFPPFLPGVDLPAWDRH